MKDVSTPARQLAVFHGLAVMQWNRTRYAEAMDTARELLRGVEAQGDNAALCVAHRLIGVVASAMGQFALARDSERPHGATTIRMTIAARPGSTAMMLA